MHLARLLVFAALLLAQAASRLLAAEPALPETHPAIALFKYQPKLVTLAGGPQLAYERRRADGRMIAYQAREFSSLARQCELFVAANPWTAKVWANCPPIADFAATQFEEGAEYAGGREGENSHPHAHARRFWSGEPTFTANHNGQSQTWGDPIDGTTFFVVEALNAVRAGDFQAVWDRAINEHRRIIVLDAPLPARRELWKVNRDRWIQDEAQVKAENLARTVEIVRTNARGLNLAANVRLGYGAAYGRYAAWVDEATAGGKVDAGRLRDAILANPGTYRDDPEYRGVTYRGRLERLFAQVMAQP